MFRTMIAAVWVFCAAWMAVVPGAVGRELVIDSNGGGDFASIAEAIAASAEGDTLVLKAGTYKEAVELKDGQTLTGEEGAVLANPAGTVVAAAANNAIRNLRIERAGLHAIVGESVESIEIANVEIQQFNLMEEIARVGDKYQDEQTYEAISLTVSGGAGASISISDVQIADGKGGGVYIESLQESTVNAVVRNVAVRDIDASGFIAIPPGFPASAGFPGIKLSSAGTSTMDVLIEDVLVQNVGYSSDGLMASSNGQSTLNLTVRRYTCDDPAVLSGPISEGINLGGEPASTMNVMVEESNFLNSNNAGFSVFNWDGVNNGVIDLGGGELGSRGLNRFIGNVYHFDGADPLPISAENNYWGNGDGFLEIHVWQGEFEIDNEPYLESDPRPGASAVENHLWRIYE